MEYCGQLYYFNPITIRRSTLYWVKVLKSISLGGARGTRRSDKCTSNTGLKLLRNNNAIVLLFGISVIDLKRHVER